MFPEIRKQGTEMVESFKYAGVVDGRSVEQDAEKDEDESGNSKGAVQSVQMNFRFCFVSIVCITSVRLRSPREVDWRL